MKIEIWSDFTCPYCYIGKRKLELAIEQFKHKQFIQIEFKSYELNPDAYPYPNEEKTMNLSKKDCLLNEKNQETINRIKNQAKEIGLTINFENLEDANTFNAHRLVKYAEKQGKEANVIDLLFNRYFTDGENIGDKNVLLSIAGEAGLDEEEVDSLLCLNKYGRAVQNDELIAKEIGVEDVPFFIFNEQLAVSGIQPVEIFKNVLEEIWEECKEEHIDGKKSTEQCGKSYCIGNDCE